MYCVLFWHSAMPVGLAYIGEMGGFGILCRKKAICFLRKSMLFLDISTKDKGTGNMRLSVLQTL